jgi:hypothetical protein
MDVKIMSKSLVAGKPSITAVVPNSGPTTGAFRISFSSDLQKKQILHFPFYLMLLL